MYEMHCVKKKKVTEKISTSLSARPHLPAAPSHFPLRRRSKKHPSVPGAKQDEGLLLHGQPGPGGGLQDQDCGEVPLVCSWRSQICCGVIIWTGVNHCS